MTVNIKGKEYVTVAERIMEFRTKYPLWGLSTAVNLHGDQALCKATIKDENDRIISTGYALENKKGSFINGTSFVENCETSAVGRALAFLGLSVDASIASADEISNAIKNENGTN